MPERSDSKETGFGKRRQRSRLRGAFASKTGKAAGLASIAAPIIGFIANDLKKPDSFIRKLIGRTVTRLLPAKRDKVEVIDITDKVEILKDDSDKRS